ncbi:FAD-dependent oxidoreductase [Streptomyces turgidiscabies]|uniref:Choline dehydrogenase-like flavoprotein n=1 Tax=Streptomyces turgidiscabies TaxID=85558 RepID=A0ABU0RK02_9ACTN|nr:FAD-dependent oxidoreductase [Streptomyces turgidiscabies]MDQ0931472.1 choline dehydrogenase-like flavoprotein [Streptomyces turgidiscabies]
MSHYDVIVVGAGIAGSLVAKELGRQGRRVLVLEAGERVTDPARGHREALDRYATASAKVPGSAHRPHLAVGWPEVTDLTGTDGVPGFRAAGHLLQDGPAPVRQRLRPGQWRHRQRLDRPRPAHAAGGLRHRSLRIRAPLATHL